MHKNKNYFHLLIRLKKYFEIDILSPDKNEKEIQKGKHKRKGDQTYENKVTALLLATTMAISGTAGAFTVSAAEAADSGTLKLSVTTGDGSTSDDKIPTPWYNRLLATNLMFRSLFLADSNLTNAQPDLADSYEISDDKLTYTITLKDGLKWSDGEELTAEDVKFSIETALKAATINSIYTSAFKIFQT